MNILERETNILKQLSEREYMMVDELTKCLNTSQATLRRDLARLEKEGKIRRFRGGAQIINGKQSKELAMDVVSPVFPDLIGGKKTFWADLNTHMEEKKKIAKYASSLILDGNVIYLDGGTSTYYMIEYLQAQNIYVITNSIYHALELAKRNIRINILGGDIINHSLMTTDEYTFEKLRSMNFDLAFLGTQAVDAGIGLTTSSQYDNNIKSAVISKSKRSYVLADSSKFNIRRLYSIKNQEKTTILTNSYVGDEYTDRLIIV